MDPRPQEEKPPKVFFTEKITPENLIALYEKVLEDSKVQMDEPVAVKVTTGEHNKGYYVQPEFMKPLVDKINGTIIEANTAYDGHRTTSENHWKLIEEHGFIKNFGKNRVDLIDEEGDEKLEIPSGKPHKQITYALVGKNLLKYKSVLVLSHFKGHPMAGFGGALKNVAIGMSSSNGKAFVHGAGDPKHMWDCEQSKFLEAMADANLAVKIHFGDKMIFLNVIKDLTIDCDCVANPRDPEMANIGMAGSVDPVALDQFCIDKVFNSPDLGKKSLVNHINTKIGTHILEAAEEIGVGTKKYEEVNIDKN